MRHPTTKPAVRISTVASAMPLSSAIQCPTRYDVRRTGNERNRSTTPSVRSVAIDIAGPTIPKARVWMRIPPIRYSR